ARRSAAAWRGRRHARPPRARRRRADRRRTNRRRPPACASAASGDPPPRARDVRRHRARGRHRALRRSTATTAAVRRWRADPLQAGAPARECSYVIVAAGSSRTLQALYNDAAMRLRQINVGCFGGGTRLPSLLGGLKNNPWLHVNAVVTLVDS